MGLPYLEGIGRTGEAMPALGDMNEQLVSPLHGKYHYANKRNRLYVPVSLTGGIALIVAATTGGHPTLWNPSGSRVLLSIRRLLLGYVSGNNAPGSLAWNVVKDAGAQIGPTGAPILTATLVAAANARAGGPDAPTSKLLWSPAVNTFTAAPVYYRPVSLSLFTGVAATAVAPFPLGEEYDDDLEIEEGTALCLVSQQATTTSLFRVTLVVEIKDK